MSARAVALRKARLRALALEPLETRVLLATLPPIVHDPNVPVPIDLAKAGSAPGGGATNPGDASILSTATGQGTVENASSPSIVIDPNNAQKLVTVYTTHVKVVTATATTDTTTIEGAYSTNAGVSWTSFIVAPVTTVDPQSTTGARFANITNASVAFDLNDNFYVVSQENNANNQTGAVFLERYNFGGTAPTTDQLASAGASKIVFGPWDSRSSTTASEVLSMSLAVDSNVSTFSDGAWSVQDRNAGNVYIGLGTVNINGVNATTNNYSVQLIYSNNLGLNFSTPLTISGGNGPEPTAGYPSLTVEQGGPGSGVSTPGQVAVVWDNFAVNPLIPTGQGSTAIEARVFTAPPATTPPTIPPAQGTLGTEVAAFTSVPSVTASLFAGFAIVAGTPTVTGSNVPSYPVQYPLAAPVAPTIGIGPSPVIVSDNTLGSFSQFQGRLYVAFVGHSLFYAGADPFHLNANPTTNTDIYLITSKDGGQTWSPTPVRVNQDNALTDGFSEGNSFNANALLASNSGRTQFMPALTVDQATGTLVASYFDTRDDAANARYATYMTTSIDGGSTFAPDTFANAPNTAFDTITQQNVTLGPLSDNQSANNNIPTTTTLQSDTPAVAGYLFGNQQGLAAFSGHVYAAWAGDQGGGLNDGNRLNVLIAPMRIAAGPRVISSTMGVATPLTIPVPPPGGPFTFNTPDPVTGVPEFNGFLVQFDRPIDPSTFTPATIQVSYLAPGATAATLVNLTNVSILPQDKPISLLGVKNFLVTFSPLEGVGTYSYAIGPGVSDRIRTASLAGVLVSSGNKMDQNADGQPGQLTLDQYATPRPLNGTPFQSPYDPTTLPIIIPGPSIISTAALGASGNPIPQQTTGENLAVNTSVTGVQVTFDRDMRIGSFAPSDILSLVGPLGPISGPFTVQVVSGSLRVFNIFFATPQQLSGTYTVTLSPNIYSVVNSDPTRTTGDPIDANQNAGLVQLRGGSTANGITTFTATNNTVTAINPASTIQVPIAVASDFTISSPVTLTFDITFPNDPSLSASLLVVDPNNSSNNVTIPLFSGVGAGQSTANFQNTTLSDNATLPIQNATAPFSATYQVQTGLGPGGKTITLGSLSGRSAKAMYILQISNNSSAPTSVGSLNSWSISMGQPVLTDGLGEPAADQSTVGFRIFVMDPTNPESLNTWTAIGPAGVGNHTGTGSNTGAITAEAVDPSDPSGNTVYIGAANGGVWKTKNFLTTNPLGPTWIPLTNFGPTNAVNIGSLAIFPRNNDPSQSIIIAGTGDPNGLGAGHGLPGVGFLRSMDGGATWTLLDSTRNAEADGVTPLPINSPSPTSGLTRDHRFVGDWVYQVTFDPNLSASGGVIVYAAVSGPNSPGLWRSLDGGNTWGVVPAPGVFSATPLKSGQATSVALDLYSGTKDANGNATGSAQTIYVAFGNDPANNGVYRSTNFGNSFTLMSGGAGIPVLQNVNTNPTATVGVTNNAATPNGTNGRIILAKPSLVPSTNPNALVENQLYEGWVFALVVNTNDTINGFYVTKDSGANWTRVAIPTSTTINSNVHGTPSNDATKTTDNIVDNLSFAAPGVNQGNDDLVMAADPTNPNIVYIGGTGPDGVIRVNLATLQDLYSFDLNAYAADGGLNRSSTTAAGALISGITPPVQRAGGTPIGSPITNPTLNLLKNPTNPLGASGTIFVTNTASVNNAGSGATWSAVTGIIGPGVQNDPTLLNLIALPDPLTGGTRLITGTFTGVYTGVVGGNGQLILNVGDVTNTGVTSASADVPIISNSRNGDLQLAQFYFGAVQPGNLAAQVSGALFFAQSTSNSNANIGSPASTSDLLSSGNLVWGANAAAPTLAATEFFGGNRGGAIMTDPTGTGTVFAYSNPGIETTNTNFFRVNGISQINGLQSPGGPNPDPQWPNGEPVVGAALTPFGDFTVNPVDSQKLLIGSQTGAVYATSNQGRSWTQVATGANLDNTYPQAVAFGAPQPSDPTGANDTFYYAGTTGGRIFVTFQGGGTTWTNITNGALAGNTSPILQIITNPNRGSNEAYAITANAVYHILDSNPNDLTVPVANRQWVKITGNLLTTQSNPIFGNSILGTTVLTQYLTSMAIDWRYQIPNNQVSTTTATALLGTLNGVSTGTVGSIVIDNPGAGYSTLNRPNVTISGGGGSGATAAAIVSAAGAVTGITLSGVYSVFVDGGGSGYTNPNSPPTVTFSAPPAGSGNTTATGIALVDPTTSTVSQIIITNPGSGYVTPPTITIGASPTSGGTTATALATLTSPGSGYTSAPTITVDAPPPAALHPILYVSGNTGVYRSIDNGQTWSLFPSTASTLDGAQQAGGYLPDVRVTDLALSIGAVNSTTGANVTQPGDSNLLMATTQGQGAFAIRLGPMVLPNTPLQNYVLGIDPSSFSGTVNSSNTTSVASPLIDGYTEQTTSGGVVYVSLYDMSNPSKPVLIGGFDPSTASTATATINAAVGTVTAINLVNGGSGYSSTNPPVVVLTGGGFTSPATAVANVDPKTGAVTGFTITSPGAGYTYAPTVSIALPAPGGNVTTDGNGHFSIPIKSGYFTSDGTKTIGIRATDAAGETGNLQLMTFTLDTQAPTPPAPALDPGSDTGTFNNDNITNLNNSTATATAVIGLGTVTEIDVVTGGLGYTSVPTVTLTGGGGTGATATATVVNGVVTAINITNAGTGYTSAPIVTISRPPANAPIFDVGTSASPVPAGVFELFRTPVDSSGNPIIGQRVLVNTVTSTTGGIVKIADINQSNPGLLQTPGAQIPDGTYVYSVVLEDLAGNLSAPGPAGPVVTIDTSVPVASPPMMAAISDTGLPVTPRDTDAITTNPFPTFMGTVGPNAKVTLRVGNTVAGTTVATATGTYALTTTVSLAQGLNNVTIIETTQAGNVTAASTPLAARLDTVTPPAITATLAAFSDAGTFNNDSLTNITTPTFTGTATPWQFLSPDPTPLTDSTLVQIYLQLVTPTPTATTGQPPPVPPKNSIFLAGEALLADPRSGTYSVTVGQFVNPLPAGDVDATAGAAVTSGGAIMSIPIANPGANYTSVPTVTLIGGGSGAGFIPATAVAVLNGDNMHPGQITGIMITNPGANYLVPPTVLISSPNLPSLAPGVYNVTAVQYDVAGNFSKPLTYGTAGAVVIDGTAANGPSNGDNLGPSGTNEGGWLYMQKVLQLIQPNVINGNKTVVALGADPRSPFGLTTGAAAAINSAFQQSTLPGLGWNLVYVVGTSNIDTYLSGQPAQAITSIDATGQPVMGTVTLNGTNGTGLLYIPTMDETAGDITDPELAVINAHGLDIANYVNSGGGLYAQAENPSLATATATATATIDSTGALSGHTLTLTRGGAGYPIPPVVTISGGGGSGATATAVLAGGVVTEIDITNRGSGYTSPPTVTIAPPPTGVATFGWLTSIFPGLGVVNQAPGGVTPANATITPAGQTTFPNLRFTDLTTGAWQNYFTGVASPLTTVATETFSGSARSLILTTANVAVAVRTVTIDTTIPPAPPPPVLTAATDSGTFNNDGITNFNNSKTNPSNAPAFNVGAPTTSANPYPVPLNDVVQLYRTPLDANGNVAINPTTMQPYNPVLVNTVRNASGAAVVAVADINQSNPALTTPGPAIPDGTYLYQAVVVSVAGNPSPPSPGVSATPAVATAAIDEATGVVTEITLSSGGSGYTFTPTVTLIGGGGTGATAVALVNDDGMHPGVVTKIMITNPGTGYTSAPIVRITGSSTRVTIITTPPVAPKPALSPLSDTGMPVVPRGSDNITDNPTPVFVGTVLPGATVTLRVGNAAVGTTTADLTTGAYSITTPVPLTQGVLNTITIIETDPAGNVSTVSATLTVRLDTTPPPTITPALAPYSDTGTFNNDGITNANTPTFIGTAEVSPYLSPTPTPLNDSSLVQIYMQPVVPAGQPPQPSFLAGEALANPLTGAYAVTVGQFVNPLPAGDVDATAGAVTITNGQVTQIALANPGAGYTSVPTVTLLGGGFTTPATAVAQTSTSGGVVTITGIKMTSFGTGYTSAPTVLIASPNLPSLADGNYTVSAIQTDVAGNPSQAAQFGNTGAVVIDGTDSPNHGDANGPGGTNELAWLYMQQVLNVIEPNITATPKTLVVLGAHPEITSGGFGGGGGRGGGQGLVVPAISSAFAQSNLPKDGWNIVFVDGSTNMQTYLSGGTAPTVDKSDKALGSISLASTGFIYIPTANHLPDDLKNADLAVLDQAGLTIKNFVNRGGGLYAEHEEPSGLNGPAAYGWLQTVFPGLQVVQAQGGTIGLTVTAAGQRIFPSLIAADFNGTQWHNYFTGNFTGLGLTVAVTAIPGSGGGGFGGGGGGGGTGVSEPLVLASTGGTATTRPIQITVLTAAPPTPPAPLLQANSDTGGSNTDNVTQDNNSTQYPSPVFNVGNVGTAKASAVLTGTTVTKVTINSGGAGYVFPPVVTIAPPPPGSNNTPAMATAKVSNGVVNEIDITSMGSGYTTPPTVTIAPPLATATGTALISPGPSGTGNMVMAITVNSGGAGYTSPPVVTIAPPPGGGTPATATAMLTNGVVTAIMMTNNGSGYTSIPIVTIDPPSSTYLVKAGSTVQLFRTPVDMNGSPITAQTVLVNTLTNTAGGAVPIADINQSDQTLKTPGPPILDGRYVYSAQVTDLAGNPSAVSPYSAIVTIDTVTPSTPPQPVLTTDTGASSSDGITDTNNSATTATATAAIDPALQQLTTITVNSGGSGYTSAPSVTINGGGGSGAMATATVINGVVTAINITTFGSGYTSAPTVTIGSPPPNAPVFSVANVLPGATVVLYRNNGEVSRVNLTAGGTVSISDLNGSSQPGQNPIPDGVYVYRVRQIDLAGNPSALSSGLTVTINHTAPVTPFPPVLDPASDTSQGLNFTSKNNSSAQNAPVFDVGTTATSIEANATVILFRAPVANGITGAFTEVNSVTSAVGGMVTIADINQSNPALQTPGPVIPDGTYVYEVQQIDLAGNPSLISSPSAKITIDTHAPQTLPAPVLDPSSDTGVSNTDGITRITISGFPTFDISGVEGQATVKLFRLAPGASTAVVVGSFVAPTSATPLSITIVDTSSPTPDGTYQYTVEQIDQARNVSAISPATTVVYATGQPPTPSAPTLDPGSQTGVSNPPTTSTANPTFDVNVTVSGAAVNSSLTLLRDGQVIGQSPYTVTSGTVEITDTGNTVATAQATAAFDIASQTVTGIMVNSAGAGYMVAPMVTISGGGGTGATATATVANGVVTGINVTSPGIGYTSAPKVTIDPPPIATAKATAVIDSTSQTVTGITIKSGDGGAGYTVAPAVTISGGGGTGATATASVYNGVITAITVTNPGTGYTSAPTVTIGSPASAPIPASDGTHTYQVFLTDLAGNKSALSKSITVTIAPDAPSAPVLAPASDSGAKGDNITNITTNLVFNVATAGASNTVELFRAPASAPNSTTLVGTNVGPGSITDTSTLVPGTYIYTARQIDQFKTVSLPSAPLSVTIITQATTPTRVRLDQSSDSGTKGDNITNATSNLLLDVFGIAAGTTVVLYENGSQVNTVTTAAATATATIDPTAMKVTVITPNTGGAGYVFPPAVTISGGGGTGATAAAKLTNGVVTEIDVVTGGTGYTSLPTVTVAPPISTATAVVGITSGPITGGMVTGPIVTNGGSGYTSVPAVSISGGGGNGATASATVVNGVVTAINITNAGTGYTSPPTVTIAAPVGEVAIAVPGTFAAGTYQFAAAQQDGAGNTSGLSPSVSIQIVTTGTTPTVVLDPASDSGTPGDGITNVNGSGGVFPQFDVSNVVAGATLNLLRNGAVVNTIDNAIGGTAVLSDQAPPSVLADGSYQYTVQQTDNVGNTATSALVTVQIATSAAPPAAPVLQASSDTGVKGDNITSVRNPQFSVSSVPAGATLSLFRGGALVNTLTSPAGGTVAIGDPGPLLDGQYTYTVSLVDGAGNPSPLSGPLTISIVTVKGDYIDAGFAQLAVFARTSPGELDTLIAGGITPPGGNAFGSGTLDIPFQGDLDGDGKTDQILYRPSTSQWLVQQSSGGFVQFGFGSAGDIPVVGDFDGVGHAELAVFRPSTGQWFVAGHPNVFATFGGPGDLPVALRNYNGTGQDVLAVFRPTTGTWYVAGQASGITFGGPGDVPVPLFNYSGNGRDTLAVFRPSTSTWFVAGLGSGVSFGGAGDVPVAADFDGIGHDEIGVYRPSTGQWFVGGHASAIASFGSPATIPLEAPYLYRVAGLSPAGIPASSLYAFNFGATAAALSAGSAGTATAAVATSAPSSASPGAGAVVTPRASAKPHKHVTANVVAAGIPAQTVSGAIHDTALVALQGTLGRRHKRGHSSLFT
jgi:hypothetical protein